MKLSPFNYIFVGVVLWAVGFTALILAPYHAVKFLFPSLYILWVFLYLALSLAYGWFFGKWYAKKFQIEFVIKEKYAKIIRTAILKGRAMRSYIDNTHPSQLDNDTIMGYASPGIPLEGKKQSRLYHVAWTSAFHDIKARDLSEQ